MKKKSELPECPVATTVSLIGSKWKLLILRNLIKKDYRFNELYRSLDGISQKVLTNSLREMISDGLVIRIDYKTNPPHVVYKLSELGIKLLPLMHQMEDFGNYYKNLIK